MAMATPTPTTLPNMASTRDSVVRFVSQEDITPSSSASGSMPPPLLPPSTVAAPRWIALSTSTDVQQCGPFWHVSDIHVSDIHNVSTFKKSKHTGYQEA